MRTIDTDAESAEAVLVALACHLPPGTQLGRPLVALGCTDGPADVLTTEGLWSLEPDAAARLIELDGGHRYELTRFRHGAVVEHIVGEMAP